MKHIAFAKLGKSIKFKTAYSPIGGDNEAPAVLRALANHNPDKIFYLVGRSDFSKLTYDERVTMFKYDNVVDCFKNCKTEKEEIHNHVINWFKSNKINIEYAVCLVGQLSQVNIPNKVYGIRDTTKFTSIIEMARNYSAPTVNWLNDSMVPWLQIVNDPRYTHAQARDLINQPRVTLSQFNYEFDHRVIRSFKDQEIIVKSTSATYNGVETIFCIDRLYPDLVELQKQKNKLFTVVLNQGNPSRYNTLKEWVLDIFDNADVYGQWDDEILATDSRFKGSLNIDVLNKIIEKTKYTFIIPIRPGWTTSKYIEMIHAGCIPFFHPTYDSQLNLSVPDILRVKSVKELMVTIYKLETDPKLKLDVLSQLQTVLKPEYYDGTFINRVIMSSIIDQYKSPDKTNYSVVESDVISLF